MIDDKLKQEIKRVLKPIIEQSEKMQREISGVICINSYNNEVYDYHVISIGDVKSVSMGNSIKYHKNPNIYQISFHTHPTGGGGYPLFSHSDEIVINERMRIGIDFGSCVGSVYGIRCRLLELR